MTPRSSSSLTEITVILVTALLPALLSWFLVRWEERRSRERFRRSRWVSGRILRTQPIQSVTVLELPRSLGDGSCRFNARSPYLRCAVNPAGPCQGCHHYETLELNSSTRYS